MAEELDMENRDENDINDHLTVRKVEPLQFEEYNETGSQTAKSDKLDMHNRDENDINDHLTVRQV